VKKCLALVSFIAANAGASEPGAAPEIEVPVSQTCQEHVLSEPRITIADWPKAARGREVKAYVVITYDLDGSGKAKNAQVTDSVPNGLFDRSTLSILSRTTFAPDAVAQACTYVRTYGSVRRSER
jgi:TonB family protein